MTAVALTSADVPAVVELEKDCFPDPWNERSWQESFARADFFGFALKEGERLVGFVCGVSLFEESELLKIAVAPVARGKGYGDVLLKALTATAKKRGAEKMFLEVREGNIPARKLYEKNAFEQTRVRKKYYEDGENAVEMVKSMDKE